MNLNLWLIYVATVFVISGTPGPNMLLTMTHSIAVSDPAPPPDPTPDPTPTPDPNPAPPSR